MGAAGALRKPVDGSRCGAVDSGRLQGGLGTTLALESLHQAVLFIFF